MTYDLAIIGGGPTGIHCAIEAQRAGLSYIILEKGVLVNSIYHFPYDMTFFSTSKKLEVPEVPFISHNPKPTRREALEYYRRLKDFYSITIKYRSRVVDIIRKHRMFSVILSEGEPIEADQVIIATGFYDQPNLLNIPGETLDKVKHYYDDAHLYVDQEVLVVGGANSACDAALECWDKGAKVTMAIREADIYEGVKYWIRPNIVNRINEGSIKAFFNTHVQEITSDKAVLKTSKGSVSIDNDYVLAMTGYHPNYAFLKNIGIEIEDTAHDIPSHDRKTFESNISGIYLAGVLLGGRKTNTYFIENTHAHAHAIIKDIVLKRSVV